jgi:histone H1/5
MAPAKTYFEMIQDAIITLGERNGSSRQAIWKCINAKYPESDYKQFVVRLKKVKGTDHIIQNKGKFKLAPEFKKQLIKNLENGKNPKKQQKSKATMKKTNKRKAVRKVKQAKRAAGKRGSGKKKSTGKKGKKMAAAKKGSRKAVAKKSGKTRGSKKTQQKKQMKKAKNQKKAQVNKNKNSRKGKKQGKGKKQMNKKMGSKDGTGISSKRKAAKDSTVEAKQDNAGDASPQQDNQTPSSSR